MSAERRVNRSAILLEVADGNGVVGAADVVSLELCGEGQVCIVVFCDDQKSGRILVDAMNDTRS